MPKPKKFAVFDIDGTLIRWQMQHAIFDELGKTGVLTNDDYQTVLTARQAWKNRTEHDNEGFHDYEMQLVQVIERAVASIAVASYQRAVQHVFDEYKTQVYRYTRDLIAELKRSHYMVFAISGSTHDIVALIAEHYGFDGFIGSQYHQADGRFTGEITVASKDKPKYLNEFVAKHKLSFEGSIAVGDSESDIAMLEMVDHPIAFNPSKGLFLHAQQNDWDVVLERKNMIYVLTAKHSAYSLHHTNAQ